MQDATGYTERIQWSAPGVTAFQGKGKSSRQSAVTHRQWGTQQAKQALRILSFLHSSDPTCLDYNDEPLEATSLAM